jgi:hypothetical protein
MKKARASTRGRELLAKLPPEQREYAKAVIKRLLRRKRLH